MAHPRHVRLRTSWPAAAAVGLAALLAAQARADINVSATVSPQRAAVGEPLTLSIDVGGAQDVSAPALGTIDGFNVQYVGPSTEISIINGQMSASVQHRYSLLPLRPGHFTLGPFTISYDGKQYRTAALGVDIVAAGQPPANSGAGGHGSGAAAPSSAPAGAAAGGSGAQALRLALSVPRTDVYLHERIPVDVRLYVGPVRVSNLQYPSLLGDGLSVDKFPQPSQHDEVIGGQRLHVVHFQTWIIPLRTGSVPVGPATMQLSVLSRRQTSFFNDPFFDQFFNAESRPVTLHSTPLTLNVLPLPEAGRPAGFSGAVGHFTLQVTAAPTTLDAGDPVTMHMVVSGSGNLSDAAAPALSNAQGFRTYEPQVAKSDDSSRTFEQVLIPNDAGTHAIPAVRFSFFDPQSHGYRTLESRPIALVVRAAPSAAPAPAVVAAAAPHPAAAEKLGQDIVYIKDDPGALAAPDAAWYRSLPFVLWQPVPLLLWGAAAWYDRRRQRLRGDRRYARFTRAGREARRGLAAAAQAMARGERQAFYDAVSRTMQEYLAAKLDLPPGGIDAEAVGARAVPEDCVQRVRDFFATCEQVRFAPGADDGDMRGTLALAEDVVRRLERQRRAAPAAPAPPAGGDERLAS
jgi:BatD DUF11 like domain